MDALTCTSESSPIFSPVIVDSLSVQNAHLLPVPFVTSPLLQTVHRLGYGISKAIEAAFTTSSVPLAMFDNETRCNNGMDIDARWAFGISSSIADCTIGVEIFSLKHTALDDMSRVGAELGNEHKSQEQLVSAFACTSILLAKDSAKWRATRLLSEGENVEEDIETVTGRRLKLACRLRRIATILHGVLGQSLPISGQGMEDNQHAVVKEWEAFLNRIVI